MIDILVPTYKPNPDHLRQAIESALNQTDSAWRMLIHDDPSDTDVRSIVESYFSDERITFKQSEKPLGIGRNWNATLHATSYQLPTTSYVQYLFQDDWWEPTYLEQARSVLDQNPSVGFVSLGHRYAFEGEMATQNAYENLLNFRESNVQSGIHIGKEFLHWWMERGLHPNVIGEPSFVMIRRAVIEEAGNFCEDMPQFVDVEMWSKLLLVCDWYNFTGNFGSFRVHPSGASAQNEASGVGIADRLRCFEKLISTLKGEDRKAAVQARNRAVESMVEKYFDRKSQGKKMDGAKSGALKKFVLQHPLLISKAVLKTTRKRK